MSAPGRSTQSESPERAEPGSRHGTRLHARVLLRQRVPVNRLQAPQSGRTMGRLFSRDQLRRLGQTAEAPVAPPELGNRCAQAVGVEVGPQRVDEAELGVGRLPEKKVRKTLLAAGADQEVDVVTAFGIA